MLNRAGKVENKEKRPSGKLQIPFSREILTENKNVSFKHDE